MSGGRPPWCDLFLKEMARQGSKYARCNVRTAAELSGVTRAAAYKYRSGQSGEWFRIEWDLIVLRAQRLHSIRHAG